jgi:predicted DNA repair protein MutK
MDDVGLALAQRPAPAAQRTGRLLVRGMPKLLKGLSIVGTAAMLWVGGHILLAGTDELGWHGPYDVVHDLEHPVEDVGGIGGVLAWLVNTAASAVVGFAVGALVVGVLMLVARRKGTAGAPA